MASASRFGQDERKETGEQAEEVVNGEPEVKQMSIGQKVPLADADGRGQPQGVHSQGDPAERRDAEVTPGYPEQGNRSWESAVLIPNALAC